MKINISKNGKPITSLDSWFKLAPPKKGKDQWKPGRSAMEMARFALSDKFATWITKVLKECKLEAEDFIFDCEPEASAGLGKGMKSGGSRNHDFLMIGRNDCVIGVEAKVSEGFDDSLICNIKSQAEKKENKEDTRGYQLYKYLMPSAQLKQIEEIGYQLFTATRAIINDAYKQNKNNAILLVIVFTGKIDKGSGDYDKKCEKNDKDFESFKNAIEAKKDKIIRSMKGKDINCWIKKIKVPLPDYSLEK